jgi:two-component system chemotaxis response regulator CheY
MKELGYEISEAGDGLEALNRLEEIGTPDIVLIDWNMPNMNGLDLVRAIRANPAYSDLPLMMVTTETEMERMAMAFMAGVNEYVMKPFDKATILDKLQLLGIGA